MKTGSDSLVMKVRSSLLFFERVFVAEKKFHLGNEAFASDFFLETLKKNIPNLLYFPLNERSFINKE